MSAFELDLLEKLFGVLAALCTGFYLGRFVEIRYWRSLIPRPKNRRFKTVV
jgi:hypothetical protein